MGSSVGVLAGETGPNSTTLTDVTVRNLFVEGTSTGVAFENVRNGVVQASVFSGHFVGIRLTGEDARNNRIVANQFTGTTRGLSIEWATNNLVAGNHGSNNLVGVYLSHASGNLIRGNTIVGNNEGGIALEDGSVGNEIRNNSVWGNEHPIRTDNSSEENEYSGNDEDKPDDRGRGGGPGRGAADDRRDVLTEGRSAAQTLATNTAAGSAAMGFEAMASASVEVATNSGPSATAGAGFEVAGFDAMASTSVSFNASGLANVSLSYPTSLQFGPDGRLYVSEQYGAIHALTVEQNASGRYVVTDSETITKVMNIPNHDDDGSLNTSVDGRLVTGLLVTGTAENPVLYVTSSDPRIGGGEAGTDTQVDTNSGIISRLTWNGTAWNHTELVRGLPRSEENHGPNGMALDESTGTLYVAMGGNTDKGAPSANFAYLPEYAYSAAILSVNLTAIGDTTYDLPTLQNTSTPFGGQEGDNMAKVVNGSPVQIYSPGYRNPYDVVLTEDGQLYTIDNGANSGWGGPPINEGPQGTCTNEPNENNSEGFYDSLHYIPNEGFYAGHPAPVRGNPDGSGYPGAVPTADPVQCDLIRPGNGDGSLTKFAASTNGIDEYTASTFDGAMQGDLLAAGFSGNVWRLQLTSDGTALSSKSALFSNFGSKPLDVTAQGDDQVFPGTIWAATYGSNAITVFEPNENFACTGADNPAVDEDEDGYSNADEIDAGTNPCSQASAPADHDADDFSNLNDYDDDNDAWSDISDPFAIDAENGLGTTLPVAYDFAPGSEVGTILDLGFTGLMTNGQDDYRNLYDPARLTAGGAANVLTVDAIPEGDAYRANNDQQYGFQFGVDPAGQRFTVHTRITGPFTNGTSVVDNQSQGFFVGNGDQDNYVKLVVGAKGGSGGIHFFREVDGTTTSVAYPTVTNVTGSGVTIDLYMTVDPRNDTVTGAYSINGSAPVTVGTTTVPGNWISSAQRGLATGVIGTSRGPGDPFPGTWKRIEASEGTVLSGNQPPAAAFDYAPASPEVNDTVTFDAAASTDGDGSINSYAWDIDGDGTVDDTGQQISHTYATTGERTVTLTVTDDDGATDALTRTVNVTDDARTIVSENVTSCGVIDSPGRYTLTADIVNSSAKPCLQVTASDVVLDGDGHTIAANASADGSTLRAVYVGQTGLNPETISNVTVRDLVLTNWSTGVYYRRAGDGRVLGNSIDGAILGVRLDGATANRNHTVEGNTVTDTGRGIVLDGSDDSRVAGNTLSGTGDAIELLNAGNSTVTNNTVTATTRSAIRLEASGPDNVVTNLTIDGTTVSFTGRNVSVGPVDSPPADPEGENNIGKRVAATSVGADAFLDIEVEYTEADLGYSNESTLSMWRYDGAWTELSGLPHVDTAANTVSVNTSQFGVLAPLADEKPVVYRVNAGGPEVPSIDSDLNWSADTSTSPSTYTNVDAANSKTFETVDPIQVNGSVPPSTPAVVFKTERWDPTSEGEMQWDFPVTAGATYEVRLYFAEIYFESSGQRTFDTTLEMEGTPVLNDYDIYADVGHDTGVMKSFAVTPDDTLDVDFAHEVDNPKLSAIEVVKVAESDANQPPTASFTYSPSGPAVNETVTFDASGSGDSDGSIASYEWDVDGDGTVDYTGQQVNHTFTTAGERTVTLTVTDDDGATNTTSQTVTVVEAINGTVVYRINAGGSQLAAVGDGPNWSADTATSPSNYTNPSNAGSDTYSTSDTISVTSSVPTATPTAVFQTERYDPGSGAEMQWDFPVTAGATYDVRLYFAEIYFQNASERVFNATLEMEGTPVLANYDIYADVGHDTGVMKSFTVTPDGTLDIDFDHVADNPKLSAIEVIKTANASGNTAPTASFTYSPSSPAVNETVTFDASGASDPDGSIAAYAWDVDGDGTAEYSGENATHTYTTAGDRTVTLTVTDDDGATNSTSQTVTVVEATNGTVVYRVNAGGSQLAAADDGPDWSADTATSPSNYTNPSNAGSSTYSTSDTISLTESVPTGTPTALFQTERFDPSSGAEMQWDFPVTAGATYEVRLYFAEIYFESSGKRTFDTTLEMEGTPVLNDYDIYADVGHDTGVMKSFMVTPDGTLNVDFAHVANNPKLSAIEVIKTANATDNAAPTAAFTYSPSGPTVNETVTFDAGGSSDSDGTVSSYEWDVDGDGTVDYTGQQVNHTYTTTGERTVTLTVTDDDGATNTTTQTVTVVEATNGTIVYRVNAGGSQLAAVDDGPDWSADTSGSPSAYTNPSNASSTTYSTDDSISVTSSVPTATPTAVFQTERFDPSSGAEMQWDFPVTAGATYEVRLYFAEIYFQNASERVFNATLELEGTPVLANYDIYADVGHDTGVMKAYTVTPDGTLDVDFDHVANNPKLSAIEVIKTANASDNGAPTASFTYSPSEPTVNETVTFDAGGSSDSDGTISSYEWDVDGDGTVDDTGQQIDHTYTTTGERTVTLTVTDDGGATNSTSQTVTVNQSTTLTAEAELAVTPNSKNINDSTFGSGSFVVTNTGEANISTVRLNLSTAAFPDMVFDPNGTAGDNYEKGFVVNSEGGTGVASHSFQNPHEGNSDDGYDVLEITFSDFEPGETLTFASDVDPTTIKGDDAPGPYEAGSVSGLELSRSAVTVSFETGATHVGALFSDGSLGGSQAVVKNDSATAPSLGVRNVSLKSTTLSPGHIAANLTDANQTVVVSGPAGATVRLLRVEGGQFTEGVPDGGYDVEAFEANSAVVIEEQTVSLGADGTANASVTLTNSTSDVNNGTAGYNYFVAVVEDESGDAGLASDVIVLRYNDTASGSTASLVSPDSLGLDATRSAPSTRTGPAPTGNDPRSVVPLASARGL